VRASAALIGCRIDRLRRIMQQAQRGQRLVAKIIKMVFRQIFL